MNVCIVFLPTPIPFCVDRVFLGPSPKTAGSLFYRQIIYPTSRFVKVLRRLHWRLMTQVIVLIVFMNSEENPLNRRFCRWTHPRIGQCPWGRPLPVAMTGFPPRLGRDLAPGSGESTPGMGIDEAAEPIRILAGPTGIAPGRIGGPGRGCGGSIATRPIRPDDWTGRAVLARHDPVASWDLRRCSSRRDASRPVLPPAQACRGRRLDRPAATRPAPRRQRARAGTPAGTEERSGRMAWISTLRRDESRLRGPPPFPSVVVAGRVEPVVARAGARRLERHVEGGRLAGLLLLARQARRPVGKRAPGTVLHATALDYALRWGMARIMNWSNSGTVNSRSPWAGL